VQEGRDKAAEAAADAAWKEESQFSESAVEMWLDGVEVQESGYVDFPGLETDAERVASPEAAQQDAQEAQQEAQRGEEPEEGAEALPLRTEDLRVGTWVEIQIKGEWVRAQLTWSSPHATLFMFTSVGGAAPPTTRPPREQKRRTARWWTRRWTRWRRRR
jgi:hypothetical protein